MGTVKRHTRGAYDGWLEWVGLDARARAGWRRAIDRLAARIGGGGGGGGGGRGGGAGEGGGGPRAAEPVEPEANFRRSEKAFRAIAASGEEEAAGQ